MRIAAEGLERAAMENAAAELLQYACTTEKITSVCAEAEALSRKSAAPSAAR